MVYTFDSEIAAACGVNEAVFVAGLEQLIRSNQDLCVCEDGVWWYPCAVHEWEGKFPFWSARQVDRVVKSCMFKGLVRQRHYDDDDRRRRGWYAIQNNGGDMLYDPR